MPEAAAGNGDQGAGGVPGMLAEAAKAAAGATGAAAGANPPASGATGQAGGAAQGYWPDQAPPQLATFKKGSDRETIDALLGEVGKMPRAPEKPDAYEFKPDEEFVKRFGDLKDDPALPVFREVAHKAGLSQEQFQNLISEFHAAVHDKGILKQPDISAEIDKLGPQRADPNTRKLEAYKRINALDTGLKGLVNQNVLTEAEYKEFQALFTTAASFVALEKLVTRASAKEHGLQNGGAAAPGGASFTKADLDAALADPRYSTTSPTYNPAFRKEVDAKWEAARKNGSLS